MSDAIEAASQIGSLLSEVATSCNLIPLNNVSFLLFAKVVTPSRVRPSTIIDSALAEIAI